MLDVVTAAWLGFIGACVGSFLNVVAYRMPRGMSVVWRPSHCPRCEHPIRARDNVPVIGWLLLRGRCRDCRQPIAPRYAIVEALLGAAVFALAWGELLTGGANLPGGPLVQAAGAWEVVWNPQWEMIAIFAAHAVLLSLLLAIALIDQDGERVPGSLIVFAILLAAAAAWWLPPLYPERTRSIQILQWKAPLDALQGVVWGAAPAAAVALVCARRGSAATARHCLAFAIALGVVGGLMGLRPSVRIAALGLGAAASLRFVGPAWTRRLTWIAPVWLAALIHILFWNRVAGAFSW